MYSELKQNFTEIADPKKAKQMSAYMRDQFEFYGIQSVPRKDAEKEIIKQAKKQKMIAWQELDQIWLDPHREMQYFVGDYLLAMQRYLTFNDLAHVEKYIRSKQWWDTIDTLMKVYGKLGLRDLRVNDLMFEYSTDEDFWVRRVAIEHQLLRKEKMNTDLLNQILLNNLDSSEFFINKAIGWALRDYSKTNPEWVKNFIEKNREHMAKLSIKEGSKYL